MQNNTVRVKIVKCSQDGDYKHLVEKEIDVKESTELDGYYRMIENLGSGRLFILKSDCEVISPLPEKTASEIYSETYKGYPPTFELDDQQIIDIYCENPEKLNEGEKAGIIQQEAEKYQPLFDLMFNDYNQIPLQSQMDELIEASQKVIKNFSTYPLEAWATDEDMEEAFNAFNGGAFSEWLSKYKLQLLKNKQP